MPHAGVLAAVAQLPPLQHSSLAHLNTCIYIHSSCVSVNSFHAFVFRAPRCCCCSPPFNHQSLPLRHSCPTWHQVRVQVKPPCNFRHTRCCSRTCCSGGYNTHAYSHTCCSGVFDGKSWSANGEWADAVAPATGEVMARVRMGSVQDLQRCTQASLDARADWAAIPAPRRGEIVRQIGNKFREVR